VYTYPVQPLSLHSSAHSVCLPSLHRHQQLRTRFAAPSPHHRTDLHNGAHPGKACDISLSLSRLVEKRQLQSTSPVTGSSGCFPTCTCLTRPRLAGSTTCPAIAAARFLFVKCCNTVTMSAQVLLFCHLPYLRGSPQVALLTCLLLAWAFAATSTAAAASSSSLGGNTTPRKLAQASTHLQWSTAICQATSAAIGCNIDAGVTAACCDPLGTRNANCDAPINTAGEWGVINCLAGSRPMCCPTSKGRGV
jgi:hypothetical protein